ncbi:hypothetical protein QE152_g37439 [Popillia japonica]|uniref:Uncharacterized protein n=1 Tax=Popillia japonica TaxID=7064 RepID=A0AAW1IAU4_POPJA
MKAYESSSDSSIDYVLESEGEGDSWDTFSNSQEEDFEINVNGYVVVNMKTNIIPGMLRKYRQCKKAVVVGDGRVAKMRCGIKSVT